MSAGFASVSILANIIIVPLAILITLCGFSMLAILPLAQFFAPSCEAAVLLLLKANTLMLKLPAAYFLFSLTIDKNLDVC